MFLPLTTLSSLGESWSNIASTVYISAHTTTRGSQSLKLSYIIQWLFYGNITNASYSCISLVCVLDVLHPINPLKIQMMGHRKLFYTIVLNEFSCVCDCAELSRLLSGCVWVWLWSTVKLRTQSLTRWTGDTPHPPSRPPELFTPAWRYHVKHTLTHTHTLTLTQLWILP